MPARSVPRDGTEHLSDRLDSGFSALVGAIVRLSGDEHDVALVVSGRSEVATVETCAVEIEGEAMPFAATVVEDPLGPNELRRQAFEDGAEASAVDGRVDREGPGSVRVGGPHIVVGRGPGLCRAGSGALTGGVGATPVTAVSRSITSASDIVVSQSRTSAI